MFVKFCHKKLRRKISLYYYSFELMWFRCLLYKIFVNYVYVSRDFIFPFPILLYYHLNDGGNIQMEIPRHSSYFLFHFSFRLLLGFRHLNGLFSRTVVRSSKRNHFCWFFPFMRMWVSSIAMARQVGILALTSEYTLWIWEMIAIIHFYSPFTIQMYNVWAIRLTAHCSLCSYRCWKF